MKRNICLKIRNEIFLSLKTHLETNCILEKILVQFLFLILTPRNFLLRGLRMGRKFGNTGLKN